MSPTCFSFFFNDTATTEIYTLSLHDALPIATLGRVDSAPNQGQLATILNNSAEASSNMRSASQDFRDLLDAAHKNQESLVRVLVSADSVMSRIANRSGTLGLLVSDSTLYRETT